MNRKKMSLGFLNRKKRERKMTREEDVFVCNIRSARVRLESLSLKEVERDGDDDGERRRRGPETSDRGREASIERKHRTGSVRCEGKNPDRNRGKKERRGKKTAGKEEKRTRVESAHSTEAKETERNERKVFRFSGRRKRRPTRILLQQDILERERERSGVKVEEDGLVD